MSSIKLESNASGTGIFTIASPNSNTNRTLTLPDNTGTVLTTASTIAGTGPAFFAYSATGTTLTAATTVKIILDTELFDTNSNFDSTTNYRFTPTVAGYYQVNGVMTVNFWNGTILAVYVFKNGNNYCAGNTGYPQTTGGVRSVVSTLVYMNGTTDYIEMYGFNYAATSSNVVLADAGQTNFNASLVRAA
jgi:hypothetical protein